MEKIFVQYPQKIMRIKKRIEKTLDVKITGIDDEIDVEGEGENEYVASMVIGAIDIGFDSRVALLLQDPEYIIEKINLKSYVKPSRMSTVKGRLIGRKGKAKNRLAQLTGCDIVIKNHTVVILGLTNDVDIASKAVRSLIKGSPHSSVFAFLEKSRKIGKERELLGGRI
jgi:ribosomal RNA assembly protein